MVWQHIRRLLLYAEQSGVMGPGDILLDRFIPPMELHNDQIHMILSHFANKSTGNPLDNPQNPPIRFLGCFQPTPTQSAMAVNGPVGDESDAVSAGGGDESVFRKLETNGGNKPWRRRICAREICERNGSPKHPVVERWGAIDVWWKAP